MKPSRFSAMLARLRVADAHLVDVGDQAEPGTAANHIVAARAHLAELERELMALRDAALRPPAVVVAFPSRLPAGALVAVVGQA